MRGVMLGGSLADLLGQQEESEQVPKRPLPEAQVMELRAMAERWHGRAGRFKVGDLVTPVANCNYKGAGEPLLVLSVGGGPGPALDPGGIGGGGYGFDPDVLVVALSHNNVLSKVWFESCFLVPYTGPGA